MNNVFLLMWLSDVVGGIGVVGLVSGIVLAVVFGIALMATGIEEPELYGRMWRLARWMLIPTVFAVVMPSPKTLQVMAIAAAGDAAVNTTLGAKGVEALNAVLDKVIDAAKK